MNRPTEGMIIVAQGLLGENEEFLVYRWTLPADTKAGTTPETPLQSFFKPATAPPTTSSPSVTPVPTTSGTPVTPVPITSSPPVTSVPTTSSPPVTPPVTPVTSVTPPTTGALICDQCNAGPFENQLSLVGHKTTAHKKPVKRIKRPGVGGYTPVKAPTTAGTPSVTPVQGPVTTPGTQTTGNNSQGTVGTAGQQNTTVTQPPTTPVIEPDSGAVKAAEQGEQATLPVVPVTLPVVPVVEPLTQVTPSVATVPQPVTTPTTSVTPVTPPVTPVTQGTQPGTKEELKATEGASLPSVKYARIAGLIARSFQEFKLQFEASFPKDDMAQALAAANCSIVDGKVVFTGG